MPGPRRNNPAPESKVTAAQAKQTLRRLLGYLGQYKLLIVGMVAAVIATTLLQLLSPYLIQIAIDRYIIPGEMAEMGPLVLILLSSYLGNALLTWFQSYYSNKVAYQVAFQLRSDLFAKTQTLPLKYFDQRPIGELMSRVTNDVENIADSLSNSILSILQAIISIVGALIIMLLVNWQLTLITLLTVPLSLGAATLLAGRARKYMTKQQEDLAEINGLVEESISGIKTIKVFNYEDGVEAEFAQKNNQYAQTNEKAAFLGMLFQPVMNFLNNVNYVLIAFIGGIFAIRGEMSIGAITSFIQYARQFTYPVSNLANQYGTLQMAIASGQRVFAVLDEPSEENSGQRLDALNGELEFDRVDFGYDPKKPVLKDINFQVKPGQTIALVGPTGSGKTTIVNLLMRFYEIETGQIMIDERPIKNFELNHYRQQIGMVLQDVHLFTGTVKENIRYGKHEATDEEVAAAAQKAAADKFIRHLPKGYDTVLTEGGSNLSQGQRQLISIARAILADPVVLIMDEATSNVDTRTEALIQKALGGLRQGRSSIMIAHRLSTIQNADEILVIREGQIIERGKHQELLTQKGFYHQLWHGLYVDDDVTI